MKINIKIIANAKQRGILRISDDSFKIRVKSKPIDGQANSELVEMLSDYFNLSKDNIRITHGLKSRNKIVEVCQKK